MPLSRGSACSPRIRPRRSTPTGTRYPPSAQRVAPRPGAGRGHGGSSLRCPGPFRLSCAPHLRKVRELVLRYVAVGVLPGDLQGREVAAVLRGEPRRKVVDEGRCEDGVTAPRLAQADQVGVVPCARDAPVVGNQRACLVHCPKLLLHCKPQRLTCARRRSGMRACAGLAGRRAWEWTQGCREMRVARA